MKHLFSLVLAALPLAAAAAPAPAPASAASAAPHAAQAPVPATTYRSAFDGYRPAAEDDATPDQTWRALNQKVGDAGGHMGMMKMQGHKMDGHKMPMDKPAAKPATKVEPQHHHEGH